MFMFKEGVPNELLATGRLAEATENRVFRGIDFSKNKTAMFCLQRTPNSPSPKAQECQMHSGGNSQREHH